MNPMWTEQLSVGNAILDSDHKKLFELVKDFGCVTEAGDHSSILRTVIRLNACMNHHFLNEELFSHALDISFATHQIEHQNILAVINLARRDAEKDSVTAMHVMEYYAQFFENWLIKHITHEDMRMKPALQMHPYDYKQAGIAAW